MISSSDKVSSGQMFPETIGFIGASRIATKHIKHLRIISPEAKIVIFSQHEKPRSDAETGILYTNSLESFVEMAPGWVVITTAAANHHQHIETICGVADAILIEKPLAATSLQAQKILDAQTSSSCPIVVGYNLRFLKAFDQLTQVLKNGMLGHLYSVQVTVGQNLEAWRPERDIADTVSVKKSKGGGVLRELSHELDLMQALFGSPAHCTMMATAGKFNRFDVEDTAFIHAAYSVSSASPPFVASINMDFVRRDVTRQIVLIGENGTLNYDLIEGIIRFTNDNETRTIFKVSDDIANSYQWMWEAFAAKQFNRFCSVENAIDTILLIEKLECGQISHDNKI